MTNLLRKPFSESTFNFGDNEYIDSIYALGDEVSNLKELRESKEARGSQHALYINRTYFGLYSILNLLNAEIKTGIKSWKDELILFHKH